MIRYTNIEGYRYRTVNCPRVRRGVWRSGDIASRRLTSTLDGAEWSDSHFGSCTSVEKAPGIY